MRQNREPEQRVLEKGSLISDDLSLVEEYERYLDHYENEGIPVIGRNTDDDPRNLADVFPS